MPNVALLIVEREKGEDFRSAYGFFFFLSDGFSENSNHPKTMNPIATPVMAIQVPSLSIQ